MSERNMGLFLALVAGKALSVPLNLAATVLVGWLLGPVGLGQWTLLLAAGTLIHTLLINWTHPSTVRFGREEWMRSGALNRTLGARMPLLIISLATAIVLIVFDPGQWLSGWFAAGAAHRALVVLFALSVWLAAEAQATLQVTDRILWQALVAPAAGALSVATLAFLLWTARPSLALAGLAFNIFPIAGWGAAWLIALAQTGTRPALAFDGVSRQLRYAAPLLPMFALGYLSDWGDHLLLRHLATTADVGLFGISYQFMLTLLAANGVLTTLLLPRLIAHEVAVPGAVRTYVEGEVPTLYALWMIATVWLVAIVPPAVRMATGAAFDASVGLLLILLIAVPSSVVTSLYTVLFNVQERTGRMFLYSLLMTAANLGISIALIPLYGAAGAAIGTAASYAVSQMLYVRDQHLALAVPALRVWALWAVGLALGIAQFVVGAGVVVRLAWAAVATGILVALVRTVRCVDDRLVDRLFAGRLSPVAGIINRTLVMKT